MTISPPPPLPNFKLGPESLPQPKPASESQPDPTVTDFVTLPSNPTLLHLAFNPDHTCFSAATASAFRVFSCEPFLPCQSAPRGGARFVQTLFLCHYSAVLGGGPDPIQDRNNVMIWDHRESRFVKEIIFRSDVKSVRLRQDRMLVVLLNRIFVYDFLEFKVLDSMMTLDNPKGLCEVSQKPGPAVVACPGLHEGQIRVHDYKSQRTKFISAHSSTLACFALTFDGQFLATASCKGTLIRVFNTSDGTLLQELRRGADKAEIYSLAFSSPAQWLAASSDKGTVHVFSVKVDAGSMGNDGSHSTSEISRTNPSTISSLSYFKAVLPSYFSSEWSVAKFRLQEGVKYIVAFGHQKNTVIIVGMDGSFYRCKFDPANGGEMTQLEYTNFLNSE